jgi:hypothetical protein
METHREATAINCNKALWENVLDEFRVGHLGAKKYETSSLAISQQVNSKGKPSFLSWISIRPFEPIP